MNGATFLAASIAAGITALVVAWLVAAHHDPAPPPRNTARTPPGPADVSVAAAYQAAVHRARREPTRRLLAVHRAVAACEAPSIDELLSWAAAHHVLVAERGVTPLTAVNPRRVAAP